MIKTKTESLNLLSAIHFAADKHRKQRRKDIDASPYINHPIEVANFLVSCGVSDLDTLQAAVLHDTIEDTETKPDELEEHFGLRVRDIVLEITDDKSLPKEVRKQKQIDQAPDLSIEAKRIKIADLTSNIRGIISNPPVGWSNERKLGYLDWAEQVIAGCRGCNMKLEAAFDHHLTEGRQALEQSAMRSIEATLEDAVAIAVQAHKGQIDKAGTSYILHPLRMMLRMKSEAAMMAAVLHDVVEDSDWTLEQLREQGFSEAVLTAIDCVTRKPGGTYEEFMERVEQNPLAREVEIADLEDNMNILRLTEMKPKDLERLEKYHRSWRRLIKG